MLPDNAFWIGLRESKGSSCSDRGTAPSQRGGCCNPAISPALPGNLLPAGGKWATLPQMAQCSSSPQYPSPQEACGKLSAQGGEPADLGLLLAFFTIVGSFCGFSDALFSPPVKSEINLSCWGPYLLANLSRSYSSKWHRLIDIQINSCNFQCILSSKYNRRTNLPALLSFTLFCGVCSSRCWQKIGFTYFLLQLENKSRRSWERRQQRALRKRHWLQTAWTISARTKGGVIRSYILWWQVGELLLELPGLSSSKSCHQSSPGYDKPLSKVTFQESLISEEA